MYFAARIFNSFLLCFFFSPVVLQDSSAPDMATFFQWITSSLNSVLQFLGEYLLLDTLTHSYSVLKCLTDYCKKF